MQSWRHLSISGPGSHKAISPYYLWKWQASLYATIFYTATPIINTSSFSVYICKFSCRTAFQNNSKFTHLIPSLCFIYIPYAPRQPAVREVKLYLLHHKIRNRRLSSNPAISNLQPACCCTCPELYRDSASRSGSIHPPTYSGSEVLLDTRHKWSQHNENVTIFSMGKE